MTTGRTLSAREARAHAGCRTMATFHAWVRKGVLPGPIPGTHSYSKEAIDAALDRLSGVRRTIGDDPYEAWKKSAGVAQGRQYGP